MLFVMQMYRGVYMESEHVLPTYVNIEKLSYHQYEKKNRNIFISLLLLLRLLIVVNIFEF